MDRLISQFEVIRAIEKFVDNIFTKNMGDLINDIKAIPSAEPKKCKDCKWWRDSDGAYRRGVRAESRCPINTVSVANGWGYCYMFEEQESEEV